MRQRCIGSPYNGSLKNILEKFYEGPLDGFFILCRERGDQVMDIYLCGMDLSGRAYHEEPKGASSKKGPRCPYRKIK